MVSSRPRSLSWPRDRSTHSSSDVIEVTATSWLNSRRACLIGERLAALDLAQRVMPWSIESARDLLKEFLDYDRRTLFAGEYLTKVDGATMYHSLEARSPFLDQELWEFASTLPFEARLKGGRLKAVLRELARRHIGDRVAHGRKRGFCIPVQRWLTGRWRDAAQEMFRSARLDRDGWINTQTALALLQRAVARGWAPNQLWHILVLELWLSHAEELAEKARRRHGDRDALPVGAIK
jgi:asparagine synthase (glutamine-hydrolysing)